jgi:hypothetical protein
MTFEWLSSEKKSVNGCFIGKNVNDRLDSPVNVKNNQQQNLIFAKLQLSL